MKEKYMLAFDAMIDERCEMYGITNTIQYLMDRGLDKDDLVKLNFETMDIDYAIEEDKGNGYEETTVRVYNIRWDTDEENTDLPTEITHTFYVYPDENDEQLADKISDWLSDEYGYCHKGFEFESV